MAENKYSSMSDEDIIKLFDSQFYYLVDSPNIVRKQFADSMRDILSTINPTAKEFREMAGMIRFMWGNVTYGLTFMPWDGENERLVKDVIGGDAPMKKILEVVDWRDEYIKTADEIFKNLTDNTKHVLHNNRDLFKDSKTFLRNLDYLNEMYGNQFENPDYDRLKPVQYNIDNKSYSKAESLDYRSYEKLIDEAAKEQIRLEEEFMQEQKLVDAELKELLQKYEELMNQYGDAEGLSSADEKMLDDKLEEIEEKIKKLEDKKIEFDYKKNVEKITDKIPEEPKDLITQYEELSKLYADAESPSEAAMLDEKLEELEELLEKEYEDLIPEDRRDYLQKLREDIEKEGFEKYKAMSDEEQVEWEIYGDEGRPVDIDPPTNVVDEGVIGPDPRSGVPRDITIPLDENGNVILYRSTDDPNRIIDSNFLKRPGDAGSVGLGQHNYFATNPMYSHKYQQTGMKNYKFVTDIKLNEILNLDTKIGDNPALAKALGIPESVTFDYPVQLQFGDMVTEANLWDMTWRNAVVEPPFQKAMGFPDKPDITLQKLFGDNIDLLKANGIKALGTGATGTPGGSSYVEYEIIPLVKEGDTLGIKPVATLQTKEGFDAGKRLEAFIETSIDTPTTEGTVTRMEEYRFKKLIEEVEEATPDVTKITSEQARTIDDALNEAKALLNREKFQLIQGSKNRPFKNVDMTYEQFFKAVKYKLVTTFADGLQAWDAYELGLLFMAVADPAIDSLVELVFPHTPEDDRTYFEQVMGNLDRYAEVSPTEQGIKKNKESRARKFKPKEVEDSIAAHERGDISFFEHSANLDRILDRQKSWEYKEVTPNIGRTANRIHKNTWGSMYGMLGG